MGGGGGETDRETQRETDRETERERDREQPGLITLVVRSQAVMSQL